MKKTRYLAMIAMTISASFLAGCGGSDDSSSESSGVTGTWSGTGTISSGTYATALVLAQDGTAVSGTWDGSYSVTGTLNGASLKLSGGPVVSSGVTITYSMDLTVSGESMSGTFSMVGKKGSQTATVNGTMSLTRISKALIGPDAAEITDRLLNAITTELTK